MDFSDLVQLFLAYEKLPFSKQSLFVESLIQFETNNDVSFEELPLAVLREQMTLLLQEFKG